MEEPLNAIQNHLHKSGDSWVVGKQSEVKCSQTLPYFIGLVLRCPHRAGDKYLFALVTAW